MNNLGFSNDNLFIGDVRVKGQDETIIIGNENGGNGYILPTEKGTEGQVLTMNADNTTSFQDSGASQTARIIVNKFTALTTNNNNDFGNFRVIENTSVGTKDFSSSEWTINSEIRIKVVGYWNYQRADFPIFPTGIFAIRVGDANFPPIAPIELYNVQATNDYTGPTFPQTVDNEGYFNLDVSLVKLNNTQYSLRANLANSRQIINDFSYTGILTPDKLNNHPVTLGGASVDPFFCQIEWQDNTSQSSGLSYLRPSINRYEIDLVNSEGSIVGTTTAPATDHNTLANLTVGDVHTQYTKLNGRSGGQILSGGLTNLHNLTLKSHTTGLNNIVIKDLNTTFEKNLQIGTNQILDTLNNSIDFIGGDMNLLNTSLTNRIVVASQNNIDILANNQIKLQVPNVSGNNVVITSTDTSLNQALNMNNNNINNVLNINSGTNINLNPTGVVDCNGDIDMGGNRIIGVPEIVGNGSNMTIQNGGGISILLDQAIGKVVIPNNSLDMNNNAITNVPVIDSISTPLGLNCGLGNSIVLDGTFITFFQGGGSFVPTFTASAFDMNNGGINNVSSINSLTPVGGLSSSTSNSAILTASTAEQSILGLTNVGGRIAPANSFKQGDAYTATLSGNFSSNNGDTLTLRLKGGAAGTTILSSIVVPLNASTNKYFELEINFVIRQIGAATTADLAINYDFSYNQNSGGNFQGERLCEANNTTFDTTIDNQLDITAQFSSTSANNSIETILSTLGKNF